MPHLQTSPIKGIIFDLDGTLYRMKWFMKPLFTLFLLPNFILLPRYMSVRKKYYGQDLKEGDLLLQQLAEELSKKCKNTSPETLLTWIQETFYPTFVRLMPLMRGSRPELNTTLSQLRKNGYNLAVLSDFDFVAERLKGLAIDTDLFHFIGSTESQGCLKPCPRVFQEIAKSWHCTVDQVLVIGDRTDTDGAAAAACDMPFLQINDNGTHGNNWSYVQKYLNGLPTIIS